MKRDFNGKRNVDPQAHVKLSVNDSVVFTVLYQEKSDFRRIDVEGTIIKVQKDNLTMSTSFPLKVDQIVEWDDKHKKGNLHFALVKRCDKTGDKYEVGLKLL